MLNHRKGAGSPPAPKKRHRVFAIGGTLAAAALAVSAFPVAAGANTVVATAPSANSIIVGSGSSTTYNMMQDLDQLFSQVPGCDITTTSIANTPTKHHQQLNFSCLTTNTHGNVVEQQPSTSFSYLDNPINDSAVEEAPIGSSNGIAALELLNGAPGEANLPTPEDITAINFARSSRTITGTKDAHGLTFVSYAEDGVAPFYFSEFGGAANPELSVMKNLTGTDLYKIYNGTYYDWGQVPNPSTPSKPIAKYSAPIFVYSAQTGSGTQATFKHYLQTVHGTTSFNPTSKHNVNCTDPVAPTTPVTVSKTVHGTMTAGTFTTVVTTSGTKSFHPKTVATTTCQGSTNIFENEDSSILKNASSATETSVASTWITANTKTGHTPSPVKDSIFYYSYGKFADQCAGVKEKVTYADGSSAIVATIKKNADCGSAVLPTGDKVALSEVTGKAANPKSISTSSTYPITRYLNNVYSNGNGSVPKATAATLNYVSEVGFICKTQTVTGGAGNPPAAGGTYGTIASTTTKDIVDPSTGKWYHDEIFDTILANGFIPLDATVTAGKFGTIKDQAPWHENTAGVVHTAYKLLHAATYGKTYLTAGGSTNASISSATNPYGYCLIHNTTGDAS
jgi:hypothetical protein